MLNNLSKVTQPLPCNPFLQGAYRILVVISLISSTAGGGGGGGYILKKKPCPGKFVTEPEFLNF